jgi:hypothetical protein
VTPERRLLRLVYGPATVVPASHVVDGGPWVHDTDASDPAVWRYLAASDEITERPLSEEDPEAFAVHCELLREEDR